VRSELDCVPGTRRQIRDDDVLLLRPDIVGDNPPGWLRLLLVLDDIVLDGTASIRPAVKVEGDEGDVDTEDAEQVDILGRRAQGGGGDAGTGIAPTSNVVTHKVERVDCATGEVGECVGEVIIVQSCLLPLLRVTLGVEKVALY